MESPRTIPKHSQLTAATDPACDECGAFEALEIAGRHLCPDCITAAGCSCAGPADHSDD